MEIGTLEQVRENIGKFLFWDEHSNRYIITRSALVVGTYRRNIEFENSDFRLIRDLRDLRTTYEKDG